MGGVLFSDTNIHGFIRPSLDCIGQTVLCLGRFLRRPLPARNIRFLDNLDELCIGVQADLGLIR